MQKLELLPALTKIYGSQINPNLESFMYCQYYKDKNASVEMILSEGRKKTIVLDFIFEVIPNEDGSYVSGQIAFDTTDDVVDNATKLLGFDPYSLTRCFRELFHNDAYYHIRKTCSCYGNFDIIL
ncbi:MAG: hypothetical protein JXR34_01670 [Bacteroidales bacterium]|nr:hypothetical protein [Bacteroidales bacterium]